MRFPTAFLYSVAVALGATAKTLLPDTAITGESSSSLAINKEKVNNDENGWSPAVATLTKDNIGKVVMNPGMATVMNPLNGMAMFVNFDTPWCVWCQRLKPTWERFAVQVRKDQLPMTVAHVDCMAEQDLCRKYKIMAFPCLRFYDKNGQPIEPDYRMDRTVEALMDYSKRQLGLLQGAGEANADIENEDANVVAGGSEIEVEVAGKPNEPTVTPTEVDSTETPTEEDTEEDTYEMLHGSIGATGTSWEMPSICRRFGFDYHGRTHNNGPNSAAVSRFDGAEYHDFLDPKVRIAPTCQSAKSNARGHYSSFFRPCDFVFHRVNRTIGYSSSHYLSTECSNENIVVVGNQQQNGEGLELDNLQDYVRGWPDECVGDFSRCYSISKDSELKILLPHFCQQQWKFPHGATHVSVNCKADKVEAQKSIQSKQSQDLNRHWENIYLVLLVIVLVCCCCSIGFCVIHTFVVKPYLKAIKKSKSDPDLKSLVVV